jgi:hypothetical protein
MHKGKPLKTAADYLYLTGMFRNLLGQVIPVRASFEGRGK